MAASLPAPQGALAARSPVQLCTFRPLWSRPQVVMATGQVFVQRFYYRESLTRYDAHQGTTAASSLNGPGTPARAIRHWHRSRVSLLPPVVADSVAVPALATVFGWRQRCLKCCSVRAFSNRLRMVSPAC